jgi:GNAT superfamily N-acetyltransferase
MYSIKTEQDESGLWSFRGVNYTQGRCVGAMQLRRWRECYCVGIAFGLIVVPEFRRQGVADKLMQQMEETARLNGISLLLSTIVADNTASIGLVTSRGWARYVGVCNPKSTHDLAVYGKPLAGATMSAGDTKESGCD